MTLISKSILQLCLIPLLVIGCNDRNKESSTKNVIPESEAECYRYVEQRDTVSLSLQRNEDQVSGRLAFRFYEKDKSSGTVEGEMKGDTLFASYHFWSEGMESFREIAFLKKENSFVMGYGEILNSGNRDVFRNKNDIQFDAGVVLKKVRCKP